MIVIIVGCAREQAPVRPWSKNKKKNCNDDGSRVSGKNDSKTMTRIERCFVTNE